MSGYSYAFNSPLSWSEPSGLAPEKEKRRDRILYTLLDMETWANVVNKIDAEYQAFMAYIDSELDGMKPTEEERGRYWKKWGGDRRGESQNTAVNNGQTKAWDIRNEWNKDFIDKYREFAPKQAEMYKNDGKKFTCEDLVLQILIDFASQNALPLRIETGSGLFNAADSKWDGDIKAFRDALLSSAGARDLQNPNNTQRISLNDAQPGDIFVQANDNAGVGHHTQILSSMGKGYLNVIQGGVKPWYMFDRHSNPSNDSYLGYYITNGVFNLRNGAYKNLNSGFIGGPSYLGNFQFKRWNFYNF